MRILSIYPLEVIRVQSWILTRSGPDSRGGSRLTCTGYLSVFKFGEYLFEYISTQLTCFCSCVQVITNLAVIFQFGGPKIIPASRRGDPQNTKRGKLGRSCSQQYHRAAKVHPPPLHQPLPNLRFQTENFEKLNSCMSVILLLFNRMVLLSQHRVYVLHDSNVNMHLSKIPRYFFTCLNFFIFKFSIQQIRSTIVGESIICRSQLFRSFYNYLGLRVHL